MYFTIVITDKSGVQKKVSFTQDVVMIGRVQGNDLILPKGNVSKRHAKLLVKDNNFIIVDLKSTNGTYVNGRRITAPQMIKPGDNIYIGDFKLTIEVGEGATELSHEQPPSIPPAKEPERISAPPPISPSVSTPQRSTPTPPPLRPQRIPSSPPQPVSTPLPSASSTSLPKIQQPITPQPVSLQSSPQHSVTPQPMIPQSQTPIPKVSSFKPSVQPPPKISPQLEEEMFEEEEQPPPQELSFTPEPSPQVKEEIKPASIKGVPIKVEPKPLKEEPKVVPQKQRKGEKQVEIYQQLLERFHDKVIEFMDLRRMNLEKLGDEELWQKTREAVLQIVEQSERKGEIPPFVNREELIKDILNEALGLGPLEELIADNTITEIMVNGPTQIYVERNGKLELIDKTFSSDKSLMGVIERIIAPIGRRIDESSPMVDARLKDGSRVNAIIPPLALNGPVLTIRKFKKEVLTPQDLVRLGTLSQGMLKFLEICVATRRNIIISGGTASGKTTTLNVLATFIPHHERIITIEDAAELKLPQEHVVSLETRPPNIEGKGEITIRDLVRNALRMRPDRIIVGECRGGEALDMLQAMNTGHDGSMTTLHANSPRDALRRLETMVLMSGMDLPIRAIREQIASAIDIIIQQNRFSDGSRKIVSIVEVTGMEGDVITTQELFTFQQKGFDSYGRIVGEFVPTGFMPKFYTELQERGIEVDMDIFQGGR